jgi:hypothetical protein
MVVLKRILTRKSILGFGYVENRDLSVQMLLDLGQQYTLISAYFGLEKIDFTEDILEELGITAEFRIEKPNKNKELGILFLQKRRANFSEKEIIKYSSLSKKDSRCKAKRVNSSIRYSMTAEYLRSKNHGNR